MAKPKLYSGIFVKEDKRLGIIAFSPYSGLMHAVPNERKSQLLDWLNGSDKHSKLFSQIVRNLDELNDARFSAPHLLPSANEFRLTTQCDSPIVINWLITKKCQLSCRYCFAKDIIFSNEEESLENIKKTAKTILTKNPLVVVITGGDPLSSPFLSVALDSLKGKVGIVIDTNGIGMSDEIVKKIIDSNASLRISLDSYNHSENNILRCGAKSSIDSQQFALDALNTCKVKKIPCTVHTVLTTKSMTTLRTLGDMLHYLKIKSWRIFSLCHFGDELNFKKLKPTERNRTHYISEIRARCESPSGWNKGMSLQIVPSGSPESVILVSPSGQFLIQSAGKANKCLIDPERPTNPSIETIMTSIDVTGHIARYLNFVR